MSVRMGVKEFRDNFTAIAHDHDAKGPVNVTNHDKIIGYYTPAAHGPGPIGELGRVRSGCPRRSQEARGERC